MRIFPILGLWSSNFLIYLDFNRKFCKLTVKTLIGHYILLHVSSGSTPIALSHKKNSRLIHAKGNFRKYLFLFSEQIAVLKGHTGLVKGVTWDPVGKYLASQVRFSHLFLA